MEILKKVFTGEIKGIDENEKTLTALVSTASRDRMDEVLDPKGVDLRNYSKNPVVLWAHDYSRPPIGKALWTKRTDDGVLSKVKFANTEFAQEIFQLYKDGFLKAFSVGFLPKDYEDGDGLKKPRRTYKSWEMLEYSAVPVPANPEALSLAISKGILKADDPILKEFQLEDSEEIVEEASEVVEAQEPVQEQPSNGLDELMAEIRTIAQDKEALEKEVKDLRFKIYELTQAREKKQPEMTADDIGKLIAETVSGVIRKHQGKIS